MDQQDQSHKRRVRYKGTHPRSFEDKYKELQPDKYQDTIEKVIQKGNTPAGMHRPICVNEMMDFLHVQPNQIGLDATLGYGGHTLEILKRLTKKGHLYAIDADPIELPKTKERLEKLGFGPEIITVINMNFSNIHEILPEGKSFDFIIADLGVSSMQIDNPERGFSFKTDGPLDLRMNPTKGITAAQRLRDLTQDEIEGMLVDNADETYAKEIALGIKQEYKRGGMILTTSDFRRVIETSLAHLPKKDQDDEIKKACQRSFQALRIDINRELEVLYEFLEKIPKVLSQGGKVAILSFHSGEDRLVKKAFQYYQREGIYQEIAKDPIRPTLEEQNSNPRSRSAKLRWAIKS